MRITTARYSLLADVLEHHHHLALARIETWAHKLVRNDPASIERLFSDFLRWSSGRHWTGADFARLVMVGSAQAGAERMLLIEGTIALLLVHGDRRYAEIAAAAAKKLMCAAVEGN